MIRAICFSHCMDSAYEPSAEELSSVTIPPYQMDNRLTRTEWARFYHSMEETDTEIGRILKKLDDDGLAAVISERLLRQMVDP